MEHTAPPVQATLAAEEGRSTSCTNKRGSHGGVTMASLRASDAAIRTPGIILHEVDQSAKDVVNWKQPLCTSLKTPENFGVVLPGVFRSAFPQGEDYAFLQGLRLKNIVTLVEKDLPEGFEAFMKSNGINHQTFGMAGTKKAAIPLATMESIVGFVMDRRNHPMLIHCNRGRHRTGCAVGILRKIHGWDTRSAIDEYTKYAAPKPRETDVEYISKFRVMSLRHLAPRQVVAPPRTVGQFLFLLLVTAIGLCIWVVTFRGLALPARAHPGRDES